MGIGSIYENKHVIKKRDSATTAIPIHEVSAAAVKQLTLALIHIEI